MYISTLYYKASGAKLSASNDSNTLAEKIKDATLARDRDLCSEKKKQTAKPSSLQERLYDSRAMCKLKIANIAMHLGPDWRSSLFSQIDGLMDYENWEEDEEPISEESFKTFIRMILYIKPKRRPGLGATGNGNIIAAWTNEKDRLTIECLYNDKIRWVASRYISNNRESAAGETISPRLLHVLEPYNPKIWLFDDQKNK